MGVDRTSRRPRSTMAYRSWRLAITVTIILVIVYPIYHLREYSPLVLPYSGQQPKEGSGIVYKNTLYHDSGSGMHPYADFSSPCQGFPNMTNIQFVLKTGASEAFDKLPTHLLTSLQCIDDFLLFSDFEQQIGKYHVYNVLDRVEESIKKTHPEFILYDVQAACPVSQKSCTHDMKGAWELDKYKFLHMVNRTWEMRPDRDWYVFAEADTYVVWNSLIHFLRERTDPEETPYVGSVALFHNYRFAHGGSGYALSGAAVKKMVEEIPNMAAKYDSLTEGECCGDVMLAKAAGEVSIKVKQAFPMFNGKKPSTLPYGPGHWCEPILTMHHLDAEDVSAVWQYEQTRTSRDFLQIKELYYAFFAPKMVPHRTEWDNLSEDTCYIAPDSEAQDKARPVFKKHQKAESDKNVVERYAHLSPAACSKVCESEGLDIVPEEFEAAETETSRSQLIRSVYQKQMAEKPDFGKHRRCFQWRYHSGVCCTAPSFSLGAPRREKKAEDKWTSGWFVRGINDWIEAQSECDVEWKEPH